VLNCPGAEFQNVLEVFIDAAADDVSDVILDDGPVALAAINGDAVPQLQRCRLLLLGVGFALDTPVSDALLPMNPERSHSDVGAHAEFVRLPLDILVGVQLFEGAQTHRCESSPVKVRIDNERRTENELARVQVRELPIHLGQGGSGASTPFQNVLCLL
jgi:hypothetical protein